MWERIAVKTDKACSGDEATDSFLLPKARAIGSMVLVMRAKNAATHNAPDAVAAENIISSVEKIEVSTGDRVFKSYSAEAAMALATYRYGREPYNNQTQFTGGTYPTGWQEAHIPILFDRFASDSRCALPAPLYDSIQLDISFDFNTTDAGAEAAFLTGGANHRYDLYMDIMPKVHTDSLKSMYVIEDKKKLNYTTRAAGWDLIDLSLSKERNMRQIMLQCYLAGAPEGGCIKNVELHIDGQTKQTNSWTRWQMENARQCKLDFERNILMMAQTTDDQLFTKIPAVTPQYTPQSTGAVSNPFLTIDDDKVTLDPQTADDIGILSCRSPVIPMTMFMDFDPDMSLNQLLNMNVGKLQLNVKNSTASGALVVYEQTVSPAVIA